jgi:nucleoside-diphosphate-sugar epimerase
MTTLVTGATGFLGGALVRRLAGGGDPVRAAVRDTGSPAAAALRAVGVDCVEVGDIGPATSWSAALGGVRTVVHCAARVHQLRDTADDPLTEFRRVNTVGTLHLADAAMDAGVSRMVFVSTIGVNGSETSRGAFGPSSPIVPNGPYALSKWEAEQGLSTRAASGGPEVVVVRPPLIYGPQAPGNFDVLVRAVRKGLPLPLGSVRNLRSFAAVDNVADLLRVCIDHPEAAGRVFYVSDAEDVSTAEFIRRIAAAAGLPSRLLPVPVWLLRAGAGLVGKAGMLEKIAGTLQVDISETRDRLGWAPVASMSEVLAAALGSQREGYP